MELNIPYKNIPIDIMNVIMGYKSWEEVKSTLKQKFEYNDDEVDDLEDLLNVLFLRLLSKLSHVELDDHVDIGGYMYYIPETKEMKRLVYYSQKYDSEDEKIYARIKKVDEGYSVFLIQGSRVGTIKVFSDYVKALEHFYGLITEERHMHFFAKDYLEFC